ncbi:MAG TPA: tripartite tricarboxylate transporter substrate binding protein [Xanthobacteraceae bacterium]|nr:tripartite tricarboxylate transporter substrate binding protein [Xanthobacteraceae bacterium]
MIGTFGRFGAVLALLALALPTALSTSAQAQAWPQRTVKFIVPLGPGSGVDIGSRLLADRLSKKWNQSVVVENQPGGDGIVAINNYLTANDPHTLLMSPASTFTAHPYQKDKLPYKPDDIVPIARVSNTVVTYSVPASSPIKTVPELFAFAKANPGKINWASATGMLDFVLSGYLKGAGLEFQSVPYRNPVQARVDLAEGRIQFMIAAYAIVQSLVEGGKVRVIAITNKTRAPMLPNVPTTTEAGYPQLATDGLVGLFGIKDMSSDLRNRIATDIKDVMAADPSIGEALTKSGQVPNFGMPAEFTAAINEQRAQAAAVAKVLGLKAAQ